MHIWMHFEMQQIMTMELVFSLTQKLQRICGRITPRFLRSKSVTCSMKWWILWTKCSMQAVIL